jgi:ATP-dependent Lon protease
MKQHINIKCDGDKKLAVYKDALAKYEKCDVKHFTIKEKNWEQIPPDMKKECKNINYCVYVIKCDESDEVEIIKMFDKNKEKHDEEKETRKYCISKKNQKNIDEKIKSKIEKSGNVLYVGSKVKDLYSRLANHLGLNKNSRRTYSLYIKDWWTNEGKTTFTIDVYVVKDINQEQLQFIEDLIWEHEKPLFGKEGPNSAN